VARPASSAHDVVLRARAGVGVARLRDTLAARGLSLGRRIPHTDIFDVRTNGRSRAAAIRSLDASGVVTAATPNYVRHAFDLPNDPYFASSETYLETLRAPQAWDLSHGSPRVTIAVVDTGVTAVADVAHQILPGLNVIAGNADARDDSVISHGTMVAGIAAATTNNGIGIAGMAWDTSVLPVKALSAQGTGTDFQIANGIVWAVDHGAKVVNLSLGGPAPGTMLCDSVSYAREHGAVVVAAAGNSRTDTPMYPAACPGTVAVSATGASGAFAYFSNFGPWISLAAPGIGITSTRNGDVYGAESGTSLAAPIVSGVAALVAAQHPDWNPDQIAAQLEQTAQDRGPVGLDQYYGYGLLDAYAALGGPTRDAIAPQRDSLEPNDSADQAADLTASTRATIAPEGDVDWYTFRVRAPAAVAFRVRGPIYDSSSGPNFAPFLQVYDAGLNLLATADFGFGREGVVSAHAYTAGRYYLRVANDGGATSGGAYSVVMTTLPAHYGGRLQFPS
jgi:subtilisin family serine protease